jgi:hypothetical protein
MRDRAPAREISSHVQEMADWYRKVMTMEAAGANTTAAHDELAHGRKLNDGQ